MRKTLYLGGHGQTSGFWVNAVQKRERGRGDVSLRSGSGVKRGYRDQVFLGAGLNIFFNLW